MSAPIAPVVAPVLGDLQPYRSILRPDLDFPWYHFFAAGIFGLARVRGPILEILAVHATRRGTGQFRRFVAACKDVYSTIVVYEITNPALGGMLDRYGFRAATEVDEGETLHVARWDR